MQVPVADYSCPVPLYKFKEARILSGLPRGDDNYHWTMEMLSSPDEEVEMQLKFPEWNRQHSIRAQPYQFARLLAKIAFSYSVAEYGLGAFTPLVVDIIRGHSDDYFYSVGGQFEIQAAIPGGNHVTDIKILFRSARQALLIVDVRLFSQIRTPAYHIVVGEIDLHNPKQAAAFERHHAQGKLDIPIGGEGDRADDVFGASRPTLLTGSRLSCRTRGTGWSGVKPSVLDPGPISDLV